MKHPASLLSLGLIIALLISPSASAADPPSFDGEWRGVIRNIKKKDKQILLRIDGDSFTHFLKRDGEWRAMPATTTYFAKAGDIAVLGWIRDAGIGTEHQTFSLCYIDADTLDLVWSRHATNRRDGEPGEPFHTPGKATLERLQ